MSWQAGGAALTAGYGLGCLLFASGVVLAQATPVVQNNAAVGVAITGLLTLVIQYYFKDRSEARILRAKDLEERAAALSARVRELEALLAGPSPAPTVTHPEGA